ncbi:hypothetical protein J132_02218, partial [Termitomyces sp. J132]
PTEIYQEIFKYACTDDGTTGRSLSLVSRYFHEASRRFQLQCLALKGERQLHGFVHYLSGLPPNDRRVRHLCISLVLDAVPKTTKYRLVVDEGTFDFWEHRETSASLLQLLRFVSPSLATLHLISNLRRTSILLPIPLPFLQSLTIHGPMRVGSRIKDTLPMFPSLQHLSLRLFHEYPTTTLRQISRQAPSLRSLSFSLDRPMPVLSRDFARALEYTSYDPTQGFPVSLLRIHVRHIADSVVERNIWLRSAQKAMLKELSAVVERDQRVAVVGICHLLDYHEAQLHWLE